MRAFCARARAAARASAAVAQGERLPGDKAMAERSARKKSSTRATYASETLRALFGAESKVGPSTPSRHRGAAFSSASNVRCAAFSSAPLRNLRAVLNGHVEPRGRVMCRAEGLRATLDGLHCAGFQISAANTRDRPFFRPRAVLILLRGAR